MHAPKPTHTHTHTHMHAHARARARTHTHIVYMWGGGRWRPLLIYSHFTTAGLQYCIKGSRRHCIQEQTIDTATRWIPSTWKGGHRCFNFVFFEVSEVCRWYSKINCRNTQTATHGLWLRVFSDDSLHSNNKYYFANTMPEVITVTINHTLVNTCTRYDIVWILHSCYRPSY
jgi:hypothetical protein